jgi:plastocyanin domain-containing protein
MKSSPHSQFTIDFGGNGMTTAQMIVNLVGLALIGWIVWYFWLYRKEGVAVAEVGGFQQVNVTVKGGYDPDVIVVKRGKPVRLHFNRQESSLCSEMVVFDQIGQSAQLPEGETVTIEFTPGAAGEIPFQCQMGMLRGKVVVQ